MADVRHEVSSYGLDTAGLGEVLHEEQDEPGAERRHPGGDREGLTSSGAAPGQIQLDLAYLAVAPGVPGHLEHRIDGEFSATDQSEGVRRRAGLDHGVRLVEDDGRGAEHREHGVHTRRKHRVRMQEVLVGRFWSRSLQRNASMAMTPVSTPAIAAAAATAAFTSMPPG